MNDSTRRQARVCLHLLAVYQIVLNDGCTTYVVLLLSLVVVVVVIVVVIDDIVVVVVTGAKPR